MKIIKGLFTIIILFVVIVSCKDSKKEEHSESMESMESVQSVEALESVDETTKEIREKKSEEEISHVTTEMKSLEGIEVETEIEELKRFNYTVNYPKDTDLAAEVDATIKNLIEKHPDLESDFENAYGYAVFPKITKAGLGIGGAGGKGLVLENDQVIGLTKLMQATLGLQAGAQQYSQVIFFENTDALDNFTNGKFKFSSEASAVALKTGASTNIVYNKGVATVIESEKGAMVEASLGTQKFKYDGDM